VALGYQATTSAAKQIALGSSTAQVKVSGAFTLPTADGSANQVLTAAGDGSTSWAAASGGGSDPDLYRDNASSAVTPSATGTNAVALGSGAVASGVFAFAFGSSGSNAAIASGSQSISMGSYSRAYGSTSIGIGYSAEASTSGGVALGQNSRSAGNYAVGLTNSYASGSNSFAAAIGNNSSSYGATHTGAIALGSSAKAAQGYATALGGANNTSSGSMSVAIGGEVNTAAGEASYAYGKRAKATEIGKYAYGHQLSGTVGATQGGMMILAAATTDATATVLRSNNNAASALNQIVAASDTAITFDGTITAMQNGAQAYASWRIEGLLVNDGGTTTLANSATTVISNGSSWGMALSADNTNNALAITCTGEASHNIRWVANIRTTEVTYA